MVEWKKLGEVAKRNKGIPITAGQMSELATPSGNVRVFAAGQTIADINEEDLPANCAHKKPSVIVKSRGYIDFEFYEKPFTHKNEMWSYSFDNKQEGKFIYYFLTTQTDFFRNKAKANSVKLPQLCVADTDNYLIPIPSLSEQARIVGILDTFTSAIDNLKEQIAQRRKQYEYYRDQLLDLEGKPEVEMKTLGEVCDFIRGPFGGALKKDIFVSNGYAIYEQQHAIYGVWNFRYFIDENKYNQMKRFKVEAGDILMSCSGTMGKTSIVPYNYKEGIINQALLKLSTKDDISNKYLKQFMDSQLFQDALKGKTAGGAIQNVASVSVLKDLTIPLPPLQEQQRIVSILDTFEASIQNLEAQLKERQKQYEYYRNKLLTFE